MRYMNALPRMLLHLPYRIRIMIVLPAFLICAGLFVIGFPSQLNGSLLSIPVVLAAWLFQRRGAAIVLGGAALIVWYVNSIIYHTMLWPLSALIPFVIGILALAAETLVVGYLRSTLEQADAARQIAEQAEYKIAQAYEQQKQLNRLKDQLLAHLNHELRTPLTTLHGYLELLGYCGPQIDPELYARFLHNAMEGCEELQRLIESVLYALQANTVGISATMEQREHIPVLALVQELLEQFDPRTREEHPIHLDIPAPLNTWANAHSTRQVLRNLLSNAFKYSPPGSPVSIRAADYAAETPGEAMVMISVKDAGPGIPPDELPLLFHQFVRLQRDVSGAIRGTGLGLYISKQLVEAMGGKIWVESAGIPDEGSLFCITLPTTPQPTVPPAGDTMARKIEQKQ
ncbi:MAG: HAMP domain-containing sensor histidine kinase [Ktedonobacteraceae bacterium]